MFLFGAALAIAGGYLIMNQVQVTSGYWRWWGENTFSAGCIGLNTASQGLALFLKFAPQPDFLYTSFPVSVQFE